MFKFFKEIKEAIQEGIAEANEELAEEKKQEEEQEKQILSLGNPSVENIAIAFSCPFRDVLTKGTVLRLFNFGMLSEDEKESFKSILYRDFKIKDAYSVKEALDSISESVDGENDVHAVFLLAIKIYMITSSVEVGFISFADYEKCCKEYIRSIVCNDNVYSWESFGKAFMDGECINNILGRQVLKSSIRRLLTDKISPWIIFSWEQIQEEVINTF